MLQLIKCLDRGGAERLVAAMATPVTGSPFVHEVAVVRSDMTAMAADLRQGGVRVHDLGAQSDFDLGWAVRLRRLLLAGGYEVLHSHLPYSAGIGRLVARSVPSRRRPLVVYTEHSFWPRNTLASRALGRLTASLDDVSIAVSQTTREALPRPVRRRSRVVVHGIDMAALRSAAGIPGQVRASLGVPVADVLVVVVANLRPQKGYPTVLRAARRLLDRGHRVTFLAAGSGPLAAELGRARDMLGLGDRFRFLGQRDDVPALIAAADAFVLPSDWECLPVAVMEAFALGTPVVATSVGELPYLIEDGRNGLLVPPGHPDAMATAIARLAEDEGLRARLAAAAESTGALFDLERARSEVEALYMTGLPAS